MVYGGLGGVRVVGWLGLCWVGRGWVGLGWLGLGCRGLISEEFGEVGCSGIDFARIGLGGLGGVGVLGFLVGPWVGPLRVNI